MLFWKFSESVELSLLFEDYSFFLSVIHGFKINVAGGPSSDSLDEVLPLVQDEQYRRRGCTVDMQRTARIFNRTRWGYGSGDWSSEMAERLH